MSDRKDYTFELESEVLAAWKLFPQLKDSVFFIDLLKHRVVYPGAESKRQALRERLSENETLLDTVEEYRDKIKSSGFLPLGGEGFLLFYTAPIEGRGWAGLMPQERLQAYIFDHELAHAMIPEAGAKGVEGVNVNMAENIADAYAMIRHFQRFGADATGPVRLAALRAARFIFDGEGNNNYARDHFTSPVIDALVAHRSKVDWKSLDAKATIELAKRYAARHALHPDVLDRLREGFKGYHGYFNTLSQGDLSALKDLSSDLAVATGPLSLKWGAAAARHFIRDAKPDTPLKADWARVERKLKQLKSNDDVLYGIPAAQKKRPRRVIANNAP